MHVLHLIKTSEGASWALHLIESMSNNGSFTFSVVMPSGGKHYDSYKKVCTNVIEFDFKLDKRFLANGYYLKKIVRELNPDIIHSWFTQTTLYSRVFLRDIKVPKLFQVVGPAHLENKLFKFGDIVSAGKYDNWIASSNYIKNIYTNAGVNPIKVYMNYPFIEPSKLLLEAKSILPYNFREIYSIPETAKIIGTASYIYSPKFFQNSGIKNHEFLLKCFEKIVAQRDDIYLIISGKEFGSDKTYLDKLKNKALHISKEKIIFTGGFSHIARVLPNFDVFVYFSKSENMGGVYESLLFEVPTISSNRGALPELVVENITGHTVNLNSIGKAVNKIIDRLDSNDNSMKDAGRKKVMELFNPSKITKETFRIYEQVINRYS